MATVQLLAALVSLAILHHLEAAQVAPATAASEYLEGHNKARAEVGVGPMIWSSALEKAVSLLVREQRDKQNCSFANLSAGKYGGNQMWASRPIQAAEVVAGWVAEKKYYDYDTNTCAPNHSCGVYTQVVWNTSQELGCAQANCRSPPGSLTICYYNPPGNIIGEKPY